MCFNVLLHFSWIFIFIHRGSSVHEPSICCLLIFCYSPCLCLQRKCCRYCYVLPSPIFWQTLWFFAGKFIAITIRHKFEYFQFATALSGQLISPTFAWAKSTSFRNVNIILLFIEIGTIWHAGILFLYSRKSKNSNSTKISMLDEAENSRDNKILDSNDN